MPSGGGAAPLWRKRQAAVPPRIEHLERMLDMTRFIDQLKRLIDQPIKIPGTLSMGTAGQSSRNKQIPGKAKRDLLSVEDIWGNQMEQTSDTSRLYNTEDVGERRWLLDLLMEESDPDSGGEEHITEQDLKEILKIHQKRRKFQKEYHGDLMNSQYTFYGAGLISATDRFSENQKNVRREFNVANSNATMRPILVSSSMDATIRIWDVATQKQLEALPYKESQVNDLCITPDGAQLLIGAWQNLRIYDLQCPTQQGLHTFSVHEKNVTAVGFQADGVWMYTGGEDCMAKIWDMRINQLNCQRIFSVNTPVHSVVLHPNQVELIVADSTGSIYLWDLRSDRDDSLLTEVDMAEYFVHVDIDRNGLQCAAVTNRGHLFLWDVSHTGMMIPQQPPQLIHMEQPPENQYVVQQQHQNIDQTEETMIEAEKKEYGQENEDPIGADGFLAPMAPPPAELGTFQMPPQHIHQYQQQHVQPGLPPAAVVPSVVVQLPHQHMPPTATAVHHQLRHPPQLQPMMPMVSGHTGPQPQHHQLPSLSMFNTVSKYTKLRAHKTFALKCRFRPDGLAVATTSADQTAKLWSTSARKLLNTYSVPGNKWVWDCAFTNDSDYMVTASSDGILRMWELASGTVMRTYQGHSMGVNNCRLAQLP